MFMDDLQKLASVPRPSKGRINWIDRKQELLQAILQLVLECAKPRNTRSVVPASLYPFRVSEHNQPEAVEGE